MTPTQVKTLLESRVLQAYAEGKEIQILGSPSHPWQDYKGGEPDFANPAWHWRVKPEKKTGWLNIYPDSEIMGYRLHSTRESADAHAMANRIACIQISYTEGEGL